MQIESLVTDFRTPMPVSMQAREFISWLRDWKVSRHHEERLSIVRQLNRFVVTFTEDDQFSQGTGRSFDVAWDTLSPEE